MKSQIHTVLFGALLVLPLVAPAGTVQAQEKGKADEPGKAMKQQADMGGM